MATATTVGGMPALSLLAHIIRLLMLVQDAKNHVIIMQGGPIKNNPLLNYD